MLQPYECQGPDGKIHIHYENLYKYLVDKHMQHYPVSWLHRRFTLDIRFPSDCLENIPIHWHTHEINCVEPGFSTIFEVFPNHRGGHMIYVEDGHAEPTWGEPVELLSTAYDILDDHANRFVKFRGKYWKVISFVKLQPFTIFDMPTSSTEERSNWWGFKKEYI